MVDDLTPQQEAALAELVAIYPVADALAQRFAAAGHELHLVGGTVRDTLLAGDAGTDLDFATSARPTETERVLRGWADHIWLTGARFGTVSGSKDGMQLEITTFRSDAYAPHSRHPQVTFGDAIEGDLARRDFTINAMAVRLAPGPARFVDPFGGLADLHAKVLRTPLDPETSFGDDPLRMVRLARFVAVLGAEVDDATFKAAVDMAERIDTISRERIRDELSKLVCAHEQGRGLDLLCDTGLAERFLPELPALRMQRDPAHRHKDVYRHTLAVVDRCRPDDLVLRLAALLHDIGKPATREFHPGGKVTFHHHEVVGARLARQRLKELRYPKDVIDKVAQLVIMHLRFHGYADGRWTDSAVRRYVNDCGSDEQLRRLNELTRADITTANRAKARRLQHAVDDLERRIAELRAREELERVRPAIDGNEIMGHLGLAPGPLVGEAWNHLKEARLEEGPMSKERAYALLDEWAVDRGLR
jgi:poly(A) polymerase